MKHPARPADPGLPDTSTGSSAILLPALLFPAIVLASFTLGRAWGNLSLFVMLGYVLYLLGRVRIVWPRRLWPWPAFMAVFAATTLVHSLDLVHGLEYWLRLSLALAGALIAGFAARSEDMVAGPAARALTGLLAAALAAYILRAVYFASSGDFRPAFQLNGLHLAALVPLGLIALRRRPVLMAALVVLGLGALLAGNSRTELWMLLAGLAAMALFQVRQLVWLPVALSLAFLVAIAYGLGVREGSGGDPVSVLAWLDTLSSNRWSLWRLAFDHPPANVWLGVGCGQSSHYFLMHQFPMLSFHNVWLEIWYDSGWVGLGLLLLGLARLPTGFLVRYRGLTGQERWAYAAWFGAAVAAACATLVDRGYMTALFNVFLVHCLVVLHRFPVNSSEPASQASKE